MLKMICMNFNPRSHERSDSMEGKQRGYIPISIHAPTRGATRQRIKKFAVNLFQSTLPREERRKKLKTYTTWQKFQSTLPREERRRQLCILYNTIQISIHAPTRGATLRHSQQLEDLRYFNPRSHERSDFDFTSVAVFFMNISIHAPTRGATFFTL